MPSCPHRILRFGFLPTCRALTSRLWQNLPHLFPRSRSCPACGQTFCLWGNSGEAVLQAKSLWQLSLRSNQSTLQSCHGFGTGQMILWQFHRDVDRHDAAEHIVSCKCRLAASQSLHLNSLYCWCESRCKPAEGEITFGEAVQQWPVWARGLQPSGTTQQDPRPSFLGALLQDITSSGVRLSGGCIFAAYTFFAGATALLKHPHFFCHVICCGQ